jgi:ABC-2 type transport system permease protein
VSGDAAWWEAGVALLISLAAAVVVIRLAERIYRRALMQTSGKLTFRQALRLTD